MHIGLIGLGSIGERHLKNLEQHSVKVTILSKRRDIKDARAVRDWDSFERCGPFDAFFITNETIKHIATLKKCIRLKPKGIFVEKPLSHTSKGLELISKELKKNNIAVFVGYALQFYDPIIYIKKVVKSKKIGNKLFYMHIFVGQNLEAWRNRNYKKTYSAKKSQGGGVLLDLIHDINYPAWILEDPLYPVTAFVKKISKLSIDCEDYAESVLSTKSGIIVSIHQDYIWQPGERSIRIVGDKGSLYWSSLDNMIRIWTEIGIYCHKINVDYNKMYQEEIKFFLDSIRSGHFFSNMNEAIEDIKNVEKIKKYARK